MSDAAIATVLFVTATIISLSGGFIIGAAIGAVAVYKLRKHLR